MKTVEVTSDFYQEALLNKAIVTHLLYTLYEKEFDKENIYGEVWNIATSLDCAKIGQVDKGEDEQCSSTL